MTPLFPKSVTDFTGYICGGGGIVVAAIGAADANVIQAWAGALVAAVAAIWGLWRDQKAHDRQDRQRQIDMARHDKWDSFVTDYRMKQIVATGKDPFARGIPPLDFLEHIELASLERPYDEAAAKTEPTSGPAAKPEPTEPRWPKIIRHLFK